MNLHDKLEEQKQYIWIAKDACDLVAKMSKMHIHSVREVRSAIRELNELIIEAQQIMKGKGPTSQANTYLQSTGEFRKLGI